MRKLDLMASFQEPEIIVKPKPQQAWHQSGLTLVWTPDFRWEELWVASLVGDRVQWIGRTQLCILRPRSKCWLSWQIELVCYHQTVTLSNFSGCTHSPVYVSPSQSSVLLESCHRDVNWSYFNLYWWGIFNSLVFSCCFRLCKCRLHSFLFGHILYLHLIKLLQQQITTTRTPLQIKYTQIQVFCLKTQRKIIFHLKVYSSIILFHIPAQTFFCMHAPLLFFRMSFNSKHMVTVTEKAFTPEATSQVFCS